MNRLIVSKNSAVFISSHVFSWSLSILKYFLSQRMCLFWTFYKWVPTSCDLLCPIPFKSNAFLWFIPPVYTQLTLCYGRVASHHADITHLLVGSSVGGHFKSVGDKLCRCVSSPLIICLKIDMMDMSQCVFNILRNSNVPWLWFLSILGNICIVYVLGIRHTSISMSWFLSTFS